MLNNTQNIWREQNTDKKQNKTAYLLSRQCGIFTTSRRFRWRYCSWVSGFQDIRRDGDRRFGYARPRKNDKKKNNEKSKRIWLLVAWNIRQQSDDRKAFKNYAQYPVMQGFYGGKTCWFMGPMHPVSEYKHTNEHRARIPMFERIRLQFQWLYK